MVCRNCGADLKTGVKYCLECGSYIEDEPEETDEEAQLAADEASTEYNAVEEEVKPKKKKKLNLSTSDYFIYGGLFLVMIVSIIIIVVTLVKGDSQQGNPNPEPTSVVVREDQKVQLDNCSVVVPGKLYSTVQDSFLYVTDNENYKFSFQVKEDDFEKYDNDRNILKDQLVSSQHEIVSVSEKKVNDRQFLLYEIKVDGNHRVLYLSKIDDKHTTFGTIEVFENGKWEDSLPQIDTICNSVSFENE